MKKPLISVIIPVYNVEKYIDKCARSLFSQTFKDCEYIFVNDASTDRSMDILYDVILEFPDIVTIIINHEYNKGTAQARDCGLNVAVGQYVLMVDSDDFIESNMLEILYSEALTTSADIVVCDMIYEFPNQSIYYSDALPGNPKDWFLAILSNDKTSPSLCNKLVYIELYLKEGNRNDLKMKYKEDMFVSVRLYCSARKIVKINKALYHYVKQNAASATTTINKSHFEDTIIFWSKLIDFLEQNNSYETYIDKINYLKVKDKIKLMFGTKDVRNRKIYSDMFIVEENVYKNCFKLSERLMLYFIRNKCYILTSLLRFLVLIKTKIYNHYSIIL